MKTKKGIWLHGNDQMDYREVKRIPVKKVASFITLFDRIAEKVGGAAQAAKRLKMSYRTITEMKAGKLSEGSGRKIYNLYKKTWVKTDAAS